MTIEELAALPAKVEALSRQLQMLRDNLGGELTRAYTIDQAADVLKISTTYLRQLIRSGEIEYFKVGSERGYRISNHAIDKYVKAKEAERA